MARAQAAAAPVPAPAPAGEAAPEPPPAPPATTPPTAPAPTPAAAPEHAPAEDAEGPEHGKKGKKHKRHALALELIEKDAPQADERGEQSKGDKHGKREKDRSDKHELLLKGRLFTLAEVSHRNETVVASGGGLETRDRNALDLELQSARFGVNYRSPLRFLSAQLEFDVASKPLVKDAFIEVGKTFFVKAGQFKVLSSTFELESPWTLPLVRRGLVHDLMTDWLDIAGRRPGVAVGYRGGKGGIRPRLTLGAFQGTVLKEVLPGDRDVMLIDHASLKAQTYAARAEISPGPVKLGAWYEHRVGALTAVEFSHFETFGVDAELNVAFEKSALRAWVDGTAGESLYVTDDKPGSDPYPWFAAGRALVGYRFGGMALGEPYVEPFGFLALMDPDTEVVSDLVTEAAVGVAAGYWDRLRVTLQGEITDAKRNFPNGFLANQSPEHSSLLLQAGARF
ncbi:MAG TPA: hypothetical protein VHP33_35590 [Polyangiaceae bacterium]|nr:hypothetical protein [Polyangiaceae bacterium]